MAATEQKTKTCRGPAHDGPVELPVTEEYWYFHKSGERRGKPLGQCISCNSFKKTGRVRPPGKAGRMVPVEKVQKWAIELVNRMGVMEATRFSGLSQTSIELMYHGKQHSFQRDTVARLLIAVREARRQGILRHKKAIAYGSTVRRPHTVPPHTRAFHLNGETKVVEIPGYVAHPKGDRKAIRPSDQYGPVLPAVERDMRDEDAKRKRRDRRMVLYAQLGLEDREVRELERMPEDELYETLDRLKVSKMGRRYLGQVVRERRMQDLTGY